MNSPLPEVSISIITYNQRDLIGRALDSALAQITDFDFEIIVGDDCSSDGTQEVLKAYAERYPEKIHLILHPRRYGGEVPGRTNNTTNLLNCRGKYTAMLDGDDFWTDPHKLQRQYDLMEARPELSMCLHDAVLDYDPVIPHEHRTVYRMSDYQGDHRTGVFEHVNVAKRGKIFAHISTIFFRTALFKNIPDWFYDVVAADYAIQLQVSLGGPFYYDERPAAAYYITPNSFMRVHRRSRQNLLRLLQDLKTYTRHFPSTHGNKASKTGKAEIHWWLFQMDRREGQRINGLKNLWKMVLADPGFGLSMLLNPLIKLRNHYKPRASKRTNRSSENSAAIRS